MGLEDSLPPHALPEGFIDELSSTDRFREVNPLLMAFKPSMPFDLVVSFQLMREDDAVALGFDLETEEWGVIEHATYADAGGKFEAGKATADAAEEWAPHNEEHVPEVYAEYGSADRQGDVQLHEDIDFSDAVYAQYREAVEDSDPNGGDE